MSRPKMYRPGTLERDLPLCACGCGEHGSFGFPGPVHYAFKHWPDGLVVVDERGRFTGEAPAIPVVDQAGAPASSDLFGLTDRPSGLTNWRSGHLNRPSRPTARAPA